MRRPKRDNFYDSVEALQADLDVWLVHDITEQPHPGYRNMGRRPVETVMSFVSQEASLRGQMKVSAEQAPRRTRPALNALSDEDFGE